MSGGQRTIRVTCAVIVRDGKVLATRRGPGTDRAGLWEFPGGKVRDGEGDEACLVREISEELGIEIRVGGRLEVNVHAYDGGPTIRLVPFVCAIAGGRLSPSEHSECRWCTRTEPGELEWCSADLPIVEQVIRDWDSVVDCEGGAAPPGRQPQTPEIQP